MNTLKIAGWTPDGYRVEYTVEFGTLADADALLGELRQRITPQAPDTENSDTMDVHAVVRGEVNNDGRVTSRIWMYAPWGKPDNGAQLTVYLNTDEDIAAFEAASGLRIADLPLTKGKAAPAPETDTYERNARKVSMKVQREKEESKDSPVGYRWKLVRYLSGAPSPTPPPAGKVATFPGSPAAKQTGAPGT